MDGRLRTIGELGRQSGLSRSALLYYDSIGLLCPSGRGSNNYRLYSEADVERLGLICAYRDAGLSLGDIGRLLDSDSGEAADPGSVEREALKSRLIELGDEMRRLKVQRSLAVKLLSAEGEEPGEALSPGSFAAALRGAGVGEAQMAGLHREFEKLSPDEHERFLRFIGMSDSQVRRIRAHSRRAK
jgi:Predicted transcriptional regulators